MIEMKKYSYRQTKDGCIISFVLHPDDDSRGLSEAPIGTVFNAEFTVSEQEG